jgi:adenine phosphoribosyltransferase
MDDMGDILNLKEYLPVWPNWPKPGVNFIDICGILNEPKAFKYVNYCLTKFAESYGATSIVAIESRGFIFASTVANNLGIPLVLIRKPNKLPGPIETLKYQTEYSFDELSIQKNVSLGHKPYVIDDLLATGGTLLAASKLIDRENVRCGVIVNLTFLPGQKNLKLNNIECDCIVEYDE